MKLSYALLFAGIPVYSSAYNPFKVTSETHTAISDGAQVTGIGSEFNAKALLDSNARKPELYTNALVELKRLEDRPLCYRLAAHLLMNSCRNIEQSDELGLQWPSHLIQHHVETFGTVLTMCDMERTHLEIPDVCSPFTSSALHQVALDGKNKLVVSSEQVEECHIALAKDQSHLMFWLDNRSKSLLFCRASRLDIDKDQAIHLHKKLVEVMEDLVVGLSDDLTDMRQSMAENREATKSSFKQILNHAEDLKSKVHGTFQSIVDNVKDVNSAMKSILGSSNDAMHVMSNFVQIMVQGNAQMAAEQQGALEVVTNRFHTRMGNINSVAGETELAFMKIRNTLEELAPMLVALNERQNAIEEHTQVVLTAMMNATELLQSHNQKLEEASSKASGISENLERAASAADTWAQSIAQSGQLPDWVVRLGTPVAFVFVGSFGHAPSLVWNLALGTFGAALGEGIVKARQFGSIWALVVQSVNPRTGTESTRDHPKEWLAMTSIDTESSTTLPPTNSDHPLQMLQ